MLLIYGWDYPQCTTWTFLLLWIIGVHRHLQENGWTVHNVLSMYSINFSLFYRQHGSNRTPTRKRLFCTQCTTWTFLFFIGNIRVIGLLLENGYTVHNVLSMYSVNVSLFYRQHGSNRTPTRKPFECTQCTPWTFLFFKGNMGVIGLLLENCLTVHNVHNVLRELFSFL